MISYRNLEYLEHESCPLSANEIFYVLEYIHYALDLKEVDASQRKIIIPGTSYSKSLNYYDGSCLMPTLSHSANKYELAINNELRLVSIDPISHLEVSNSELHIDFDLVFLIFFLLNRLEEKKSSSLQLDRHKRFNSNDCFLVRHKIFNFPIIDNWIYFIRAFFLLESNEVLETSSFSGLSLSMDVDHLELNFSIGNALKNIYRDIRYSKIMKSTFSGNLVNIFNKSFNDKFASLVNFSDFLNYRNATGSFFFMAADKSQYDSGYIYSDKKYNCIAQKLTEDGHKVGWHPGYYSIESRESFINEFKCFEQRYGFKPRYVRHHYLRWSPELSWSLMEELGIIEDHSIGFSDKIGYKVGTAKPFRPFNPNKGSKYKLIVHPLMIMDDVAFSFNNKWLNKIQACSSEAVKIESPVTLLIHNSRLLSNKRNCNKIMKQIFYATSVTYNKLNNK